MVSTVSAFQRDETRRFLQIWIAHVVSMIGSGLTSFTLGVWILKHTDSVTLYAMNAVAAAAPGLLLGPVAGVVIDRWDRQKVMILGALGSAGATLGLILLLSSSDVGVVQIYVLVAINAAFGFVQIPAFTAVTTLLLPARQFARASGMINFGHSGAYIVAPILAGWLMEHVQAQSILWIDVVTFGFAAFVLWLVSVPKPPPSDDSQSIASWRQDLLFGLTYIARRSGLAAIVVYFFILNLLVPMCLLLATPLVLSFASTDDLGLALGVAASGSVVGSVAIIAWGGPGRKIPTILKLTPLMAFGLLVAGTRPSLAWVAGGLFLTFLVPPLIGAMTQAIWQTKVPPDVQGRVFTVRQMLAHASAPVGFLLAGPLTENVFQPLMQPGGALAGTMGVLIGVGEGRGVALMYWMLALFVLATVAGGAMYGPLRSVERDLPDAFSGETVKEGRAE